MKVFFGGSFDPIHVGHLRMATEAREWLGSEQIILLPCRASHKSASCASSEQVIEMLELCVAEDPALALDTRELVREGVSYTYETLLEFKKDYPDHAITLVIGGDSAENLHSWHKIEEFSSLCHLVVMLRPEADREKIVLILQELGFAVSSEASFFNTRSNGLASLPVCSQLAISSSDIRDRVNQSQSVRYLITGAVEQFICDNKLYK